MSEVRAPDPTLDAYAAEDKNYYLVGLSALDVEMPVAHHVADGCASAIAARVPAAVARWFARPCHTCFPDAPPLGTDPLNRPNAGRYLAWQVKS